MDYIQSKFKASLDKLLRCSLKGKGEGREPGDDLHGRTPAWYSMEHYNLFLLNREKVMVIIVDINYAML